MKSHIYEKDKKINLLESVSSVPAKICKPTFRNIGTDFSTDHVEKKNSLYRGNILNQKPYEECVMNSSNKVMYNDDTTIEQNEYSSIKDYNPNNSLVLRNKIRDLESQIQDLQEANENAAQIMSLIKQKSLMETSNSTQSIISELIEKNNVLRDEVDRLHQSIPVLKGDTISAQYLRQELDNLKEDLSALKRQNSLIVMENIALKNQLKKKEMDVILPKKHENRNDAFSQLDEYTQQNKSIRSDTYELNNHSKDLSDSDDSIYIPPSSIISNNHNKAMSMNNISSNLNSSLKETLSNQPKKVCKLLPQSNKKKPDVYLAKKNIRHLSELRENGYTDSNVGNDKPIVLLENEDCSYEKNYIDLSNDSTDSILSDANKEMQEMTHQSEVGSHKSNFTIRSKYDKSLENDVQIEKTFHKREVLDNINDLEAIDINKFSTLGRTAYAPRISYDVNIGDVVKFIRQGGRISKGLVHYVGPLPSRKDTYLGIELEVEDGKHDGIYDGKRYFQCIRNKGVFVAFNKIIMVYSRKN